MTFDPKEKVTCDLCNDIYNRCNKSRHYKTHHPEAYGFAPKNQSVFQGAIREGHPEEQKDVTQNLNQFDHFDTIPQSNGIPEEVTDESDDGSDLDEEVNNHQFKKVNVGNKSQQQLPQQVIVRNFTDTKTISNVNALNKRLVEVINNFNGHIKKIYSEKADKTYVSNLQNQVSHMKIDIEALRRTLTEQSRLMGNVQNVYRHSKKHRNDRTSKHISKKIENVVKQKAGNNVKTAIVLENVKKNLEANKQNIDKSYDLIQLFTDRVDRLEGDMKVVKDKVSVIDKSNNILIQNSKRQNKELEKHEEKLDELEKKKPSKNDVINLIYLILDRADVKVNKNMVKDLLGGKIETPSKKEPSKLKVGKDPERSSSKHIGDMGGNSPITDPKQSVKEISKHFDEEIDELINKMRLTKKDELNKTTLKSMKNIIEKHSHMGHLNEIKKYMENLPKNKSKNNKKKAVMRKHLHTTIKNIEVK